MSVVLPAEKPTMMRIGLVGKSCALADARPITNAAMPAAMDLMFPPKEKAS
jgi:hypothetical protein